MKRAALKLARAPKRPPLSLVKKALRLFAGRGIPREVRHANARKWLASMAALGDKHILRKDSPAKWGQPGKQEVSQVYAPRRLGGQQ